MVDTATVPALQPCACGSASQGTEVHDIDGVRTVDVICTDCGAYVSGCPSLAAAHESWNEFAREQRTIRDAATPAAVRPAAGSIPTRRDHQLQEAASHLTGALCDVDRAVRSGTTESLPEAIRRAKAALDVLVAIR